MRSFKGSEKDLMGLGLLGPYWSPLVGSFTGSIRDLLGVYGFWGSGFRDKSCLWVPGILLGL